MRRRSESSSSRSSTACARAGSASSDSANRRTSLATSPSRTTRSRSSEPTRSSSGASRSSGATPRSAAAASARAPSPSSGSSASAAAAVASPSSATCRMRSRSPRSASSSPGSSPSVSSTSAASSSRRARSASAPRSSSSRRRVASPRWRHASRASHATGLLVGADERVEQVALVRWAGETALGELPREREQPIGRGDEILARDAPAPGEGARAAVGAHPARDDEARLVVRPEVAQRLEPLLVEEPVGHLELGLDVRLATRGADGRRVALRAEQEPDRLGDDRLAGAGLARERDEPGRELEVGLADQDEVLDPQSAKHTGDRRQAPRAATPVRWAGREALAVAADEGRVGERGEERVRLAEAHGDGRRRPPPHRCVGRRPGRRPVLPASGSRRRRPSRAARRAAGRGASAERRRSSQGRRCPTSAPGPPFERL